MSRHGSQSHWYARLPFWQSNEDFIAPNIQTERQIIFRDVVAIEYSVVSRLDAVEFKINRGPGVHLLEKNNVL